MDLRDSASAERFRGFVSDLAAALGHSDRVRPFSDYCVGLLSAEGRKSVEPLAALTAPQRTAAQHQSLLHLVAQAPWSDRAVLRRVRERVLAAITDDEPLQAWIIDDTGFPKKGRHSVGVVRQYCGQLGKLTNCQVAVSLSLATHQASVPIAWRLYLPKEWAQDPARRQAAGVPEEIAFRTKPQIALDQVREALAERVPPAVVLMDPGYGADGEMRAGLSALGMSYVAGILPNTLVWRPGTSPLPARSDAGRGRGLRRHRLRRDAMHQPVSVKQLALELPMDDWRCVTWREGSNTTLRSRFARLRVRPAQDDGRRSDPAPAEWLLIEWPKEASEPEHYWLSTLPVDISFEGLVDRTKLRWRIERDYLELKQEIGLGHYEGRGWRGFHHHASLCIAAYGFLVGERAAIPPSRPARRRRGAQLAFPADYQPRGAAHSLAASPAQLDCHSPLKPGAQARAGIATLPLLRTTGFLSKEAK